MAFFEKIPSILCVQPLPGIGDMVWFLPHLRALAQRDPYRQIMILTKKSSMADELLVNEPWFGGCLWLERNWRDPATRKQGAHDGPLGWWRLGRMLEPYHFSETWILHPSSFYARAAWVAGIPQRYGYRQRLLGLHGLNFCYRLTSEEAALHPREQATTFLQAFDLKVPTPEPLTVREGILPESLSHLPPHTCRVILGIGASGPDKVWPIDAFHQLIRLIWKKYGAQVQFFLSGGPAEQTTAQEILSGLSKQQQRCVHNATHLTLEQSVALITTADVYIGGDTGLMNIAVNQGCWAYTLFGPTKTVYSSLIVPFYGADKTVASISPEEIVAYFQRDFAQHRFQKVLP